MAVGKTHIRRSGSSIPDTPPSPPHRHRLLRCCQRARPHLPPPATRSVASPLTRPHNPPAVSDDPPPLPASPFLRGRPSDPTPPAAAAWMDRGRLLARPASLSPPKNRPSPPHRDGRRRPTPRPMAVAAKGFCFFFCLLFFLCTRCRAARPSSPSARAARRVGSWDVAEAARGSMDTVTSVASAPHARAPGLLSEKLSYPTPSPLLFMLQLPPSVPPPQPPGLLHLLRVPPCSDRAGGHGDGPLGLKGRTRSPPRRWGGHDPAAAERHGRGDPRWVRPHPPPPLPSPFGHFCPSQWKR